jgi:hypothetical protein
VTAYRALTEQTHVISSETCAYMMMMMMMMRMKMMMMMMMGSVVVFSGDGLPRADGADPRHLVRDLRHMTILMRIMMMMMMMMMIMMSWMMMGLPRSLCSGDDLPRADGADPRHLVRDMRLRGRPHEPGRLAPGGQVRGWGSPRGEASPSLGG